MPTGKNKIRLLLDILYQKKKKSVQYEKNTNKNLQNNMGNYLCDLKEKVSRNTKPEP